MGQEIGGKISDGTKYHRWLIEMLLKDVKGVQFSKSKREREISIIRVPRIRDFLQVRIRRMTST